MDKSQQDYLVSLVDRKGRITPDDIVEDAKDASSPLHSLFEWDDKVAAHQQRINTARTLIRSVIVVIRNTRTVIRAPFFVRDPEMPGDKQGYRSIEKLRDESDLAREAVLYEFRRAIAALERARTIAEALDLHNEIDPLIEGATRIRSIFEQQPAATQ